jgi:hypothetical protein
LTERLWALERDRAGLDETRWKLGWCATKSYVGITYMWGDPGAERGEIFLSKYLMLDPSFTNALGCLRHELAHALVGPDEDHGPAWAAAARAMETPKDWATDTTRGVLPEARRLPGGGPRTTSTRRSGGRSSSRRKV